MSFMSPTLDELSPEYALRARASRRSECQMLMRSWWSIRSGAT